MPAPPLEITQGVRSQRLGPLGPCEPQFLSSLNQKIGSCWKVAFHVSFASETLRYWRTQLRDGVWCFSTKGAIFVPISFPDSSFSKAAIMGAN